MAVGAIHMIPRRKFAKRVPRNGGHFVRSEAPPQRFHFADHRLRNEDSCNADNSHNNQIVHIVIGFFVQPISKDQR